MANKSKGKVKKNQNNQMEIQILNLFKEIDSKDVNTIKNLVSKIEAKIKELEDANGEKEKVIITKARDKVKKINDEAHQKAQNIERDATQKAENIIKTTEAEKETLLEEYKQTLESEHLNKEQEWEEKDKLIEQTQNRLNLLIKQKEEEIYNQKANKFEDYEKESQQKLKSIEESVKANIEAINKKYETFQASNNNKISKTENLLVTIEKLNNQRKELETEVSLYKTHRDKYPVDLFTKYKNENETLRKTIETFENDLLQQTKLNRELKRTNIELNANPNIIEEIEKLEEEVKGLREFKMNAFSEDKINEWKTKAESYDHLVLEKNDLYKENVQLQTIIDQERIDQLILSRIQKANKVMENELEKAKYELNLKSEEYKNIENRFIGLGDIDKEYVNYAPKQKPYNSTLKDFVENFRNYLASGWYHEKLYFDHTILRAFIAGMAASNLLVLEGLSGTGKSSLPQAFGSYINTAKTNSSLIPVQQSWRDRNELLGYFNAFTKTYNETDFLKVLYNAVCDYNNIHIIILDEMNIARIEYYFSDFLSALQKQPEERYISIIPSSSKNDPSKLDKGRLLVGNNIWFVGTANDDDSTFTITDKVYDRSIPIYFDEKGKEFTTNQIDRFKSVDIDASTLNELFNEAIKNNSVSEAYMDKIFELDSHIKEKVGITFGNRIEKQIKQFIPVFVAAGGTQDEAFDMILERKVLRKFESQLNSKMIQELDDIELKIIELFQEKDFSRSLAYIDRLRNMY